MSTKTKKIGLILFVVFTLLLFYWPQVTYPFTEEVVTITVVDKDPLIRVSSGNNSNKKRLIYTTTGTYENSFSLYHMKFGMVALHNTLQIGGTYKVKIAGKVVKTFGYYQNIIEVIGQVE